MGQRYSDEELAQGRAKDTRDPHAHARIDALQKELVEILENIDPDIAGVAKTRFKMADKRVEKRLPEIFGLR